MKSVVDVSLDEFMDDAEANVEPSAESNSESSGESNAVSNHYQYLIEEVNHAVQEDFVSIRA